MFAKARRSNSSLITLGGVAVPKNLEALQWLLVGSTGSGKSTVQDEMLSSVMLRPQSRCIVVDPNGTSLSRYYKDGDTILNPFDVRSEGWSLMNEIRSNYDYRMLARSVVPNGHGSDAVWNGYAQNFLSQVMMAMMKRGETNTDRLLYWITIASTDELKELLAGTSAFGLFESGAERAFASTRFVATNFLAPHEYLRPGDFSLREWLVNGSGNLYLTWNERMSDSLKPLISCWVDIFCNAALSLSPGQEAQIWLVLDELGALGQISSLESALTRGRKHNLRVLAALQSISQLKTNYGVEGANTMLSCFRNLCVLGVSNSDPETADVLSRCLGERDIERLQFSSNTGPGGISRGVSSQRSSERAAIPSEITGLPNLEGYLVLSGDEPIRRIRITHQNLPEINVPIQEAP